MLHSFTVIVCAFIAASSGLTVERRAPATHDYEVSENEHFPVAPLTLSKRHGGGDYGFRKDGFSAGSGLKTIAEGSAEQANNAVANQHAAGTQAAAAAKNKLAQAALGSAATAQAALIGKYILVRSLESDVKDAEISLQAELRQLEQAEKAASAAEQAVRQAEQAIDAILNAANGGQGTFTHAQQAAEETTTEFGTQQAMVGAAEQKFSTKTQELDLAQADLHSTREAAERATTAAQLAQSNAAQAAENASVTDASRHEDGVTVSVGGLSGYNH